MSFIAKLLRRQFRPPLKVVQTTVSELSSPHHTRLSNQASIWPIDDGSHLTPQCAWGQILKFVFFCRLKFYSSRAKFWIRSEFKFRKFQLVMFFAFSHKFLLKLNLRSRYKSLTGCFFKKHRGTVYVFRLSNFFTSKFKYKMFGGKWRLFMHFQVGRKLSYDLL